MKISKPSTIYDLPAFAGLRRGQRFGMGNKSGRAAGPLAADAPEATRLLGFNRQSAIGNRQFQEGIALVITLIMLAITLVMAVAFMALARRERNSVSTSTDTTTARLAAESAEANAQAQIVASMLNGFNGFGSSNAYNLRLLVSTNYINPLGFNPNSGNPTNVNYDHLITGGLIASSGQRNQNISNLWFLPRAPVFVPSNQPVTSYDFRYYLDLNENGKFETNGWQTNFDAAGKILYDANNNPVVTFQTGDPEWIGVLEHPDAPHGPNNHFIARYAFIAVPVGNTLDINYIHDQANNGTLVTPAQDYFMRNQGVGSWEINLAAFLADLNTNIWGQAVGSGPNAPSGSALYYQYNEPVRQNFGHAFDDARALLAYRYDGYGYPLARADNVFAPARVLAVFPYDGIDDFSDGPLQTTLDFNADATPKNPREPWSGADNTNHYFALGDFFDTSKVGSGANSFVGRLSGAGNAPDTYDRYTYYRMLDELGSDSLPDDGKLNLNYSNAVVNYTNINGTHVVTGINVVTGAETNLMPWTPQNFFNAAADQMLRLYSTTWFQSNPSNYLITYYDYVPRGYVDATGLGVTNFPNYGVTNQIPSFGITNIPVLINSNFVYSPAVNRLLQLAANLYDATTNGPLVGGKYLNLPHVFRPVFERDYIGNVFIVGYTNLYSGNGPNTVSGPADLQLAAPHPISDLPFFNTAFSPIHDTKGLVNVYGVPWIIGAKKGLPNFNQFYMVNQAQVTRKIEVTRTGVNPRLASYTTNQMYIIGISNNLGLSWWNSYYNDYPRPLTVYAADIVGMGMTNYASIPNRYYAWNATANFSTGGSFPGAPVVINPWPGSKWSGSVPNAVPSGNSSPFVNADWSYIFQSPLVYNFKSGLFDDNQWQTTSPPLPELDQFGLLITNYLQAYILDGHNVIDYVQLRDPISIGGLNQGLADPNYIQANSIYYQWSTNLYGSGPSTPYGVINQLYISGHPGAPYGPTAANLLPTGGQWSTAPTPMGQTTPDAEAAFYNGFFVPNFQYQGQNYVNNQLSIQAPYTPSRTVYSSFLLQANDPLVHYTSSDLNSQYGTVSVWQNGSFDNAIWYQSDDPVNQPLPQPPQLPIKGRYQPWGASEQMAGLQGVDTSGYNLAFKDPLAWGSDYWDFPTNLYPSVGWIGRVHRGTPWQTIYLKSTNVLADAVNIGSRVQNVGLNTWAQWTGDIQTDFGQYFDAVNSAPQQDYLLFDIFTTRFNDNSVRGTLPVNVGVGQPDGGLAAWSALLSGMVTLTNNAAKVFPTTVFSYTNLIINPAGIVNSAAAYTNQPPVWQIVNGPFGINATRANTNMFPYQSFTHAGSVLATPALSTYSPFLNNGNLTGFGQQQWAYGINDEEYEWLPQHIMGLVRASEPRYVLYCYGQALRPAPNGTVLSGSFSQLVTNYQVVAESGLRVVIRVDNANTATPRAVVESSTVLPPQ